MKLMVTFNGCPDKDLLDWIMKHCYRFRFDQDLGKGTIRSFFAEFQGNYSGIMETAKILDRDPTEHVTILSRE